MDVKAIRGLLDAKVEEPKHLGHEFEGRVAKSLACGRGEPLDRLALLLEQLAQLFPAEQLGFALPGPDKVLFDLGERPVSQLAPQTEIAYHSNLLCLVLGDTAANGGELVGLGWGRGPLVLLGGGDQTLQVLGIGQGCGNQRPHSLLEVIGPTLLWVEGAPPLVELAALHRALVVPAIDLLSPDSREGSAASASTTTTTTTTSTLPAFSSAIEISGRGDDVVDVEVPDDAPAIVTFTHDGGSNFAVWSYHQSGDRIDLLVNTIGAYEGTRPINFQVGEEVAFFEVNANGNWTILIEPLGWAPAIPASGSFQGQGDAVIIDTDPPSSAARVTFTHDGRSNFAVWAWTTSRQNLLVNEIGAYEGTVLAQAGTIVYDIVADGNWTIDVGG